MVNKEDIEEVIIKAIHAESRKIKETIKGDPQFFSKFQRRYSWIKRMVIMDRKVTISKKLYPVKIKKVKKLLNSVGSKESKWDGYVDFEKGNLSKGYGVIYLYRIEEGKYQMKKHLQDRFKEKLSESKTREAWTPQETSEFFSGREMEDITSVVLLNSQKGFDVPHYSAIIPEKGKNYFVKQGSEVSTFKRHPEGVTVISSTTNKSTELLNETKADLYNSWKPFKNWFVLYPEMLSMEGEDFIDWRVSGKVYWSTKLVNIDDISLVDVNWDKHGINMKRKLVNAALRDEFMQMINIGIYNNPDKTREEFTDELIDDIGLEVRD